MAHAQWLLAVAFVMLAAWSDWRSRRIPNRLTLPAFFVAVGVNAVVAGWSGALWSLAGAGLMLVVLLPLVWLRGLGAGDWKLMGVLGAFLGPAPAVLVFFGSTILAGLMATVQMIRARRVAITLANLWELVRGFTVYGLAPHPAISLDNPKLNSLPYGVAAAGATIGLYALGLTLAQF